MLLKVCVACDNSEDEETTLKSMANKENVNMFSYIVWDIYMYLCIWKVKYIITLCTYYFVCFIFCHS